MERPTDPRLLVGTDTADDAGVFLLQEGLALVQTVDLLTPMVEDPHTFGRIAAANSLSDVYAMGGTPVTVLNVVGFPGPMDKKVLAEILRGGQASVSEAKAVVVGGHTFNEKEIKYGLSVTGRIDPRRIVTNAAAKPGDVLVLTKPLGTGVFAQAMMTQDEVDPQLYRAATASMMQLNRAASEAMLACGVHSATDITGYGLLGHAQEMAAGSGVRIRFSAPALPLLPGVLAMAETMVDAGVAMNESSFGDKVEWKGDISPALKNILWESQSSGGLLIALAENKAADFQRRAKDAGILAAVVGSVVAGPAGTVEVRR
ncbi:selenide, water dikinase SelD [candidate division WOR-3 bacterium]|nr:selenide, water dikinase SelD [candidate division WOR-3 bacterium]